MAKNKLNIIYTKNENIFFKIKDINEHVKNKVNDKNPIGTQADIDEIDRGNTYAVFKDLKDTKITLKSFKESLDKKGVKDEALQNKILIMLLQHRGGIQYKLGKLVSDVLMEDAENMLGVKDQYSLDLEVNGPHDVTLTVKTTLIKRDPMIAENATDALETCIKINITPEEVSIADFEVEKLSKEESVDEAFKFIEDNQQNILEKLVSFIKHALGYNSELKLEDSKDAATMAMN